MVIDDDQPGFGLMCGIGAREFKFLCDNPFSGGLGMSPQDVMNLTLDQIVLLLCPEENLPTSGLKKMNPGAMPQNNDGKVKVRGDDGKLYEVPVEEFYGKK